MRHTNQISGCAALALVLLASSPLAAETTASFSITGTFAGGSLDGIYTSPYPGTVNGSTVPVICDDFANNSYNPEAWTANVTTLSSINAGTDTAAELNDLKWKNANSGGTITVTVPGPPATATTYPAWDLNQQTAYDVAAYLAIEITESPAASTSSEDFSYALWELFDAADDSSSNLPSSSSDTVVNWLNGIPNSGDKDLTTLTNATVDVENAISAVCGGSPCSAVTSGATPSVLSGWNVNIYSFDTCTSSNCSPGDQPQEFMTATHVPEPSSLAVFGIYVLFGGVGLLLFGRRRIFRSDS